jgi:Putative phage tail protein
VIRFVMRERGPVGVVAPDNMVAAGGASAEVLELTRAQETELPQVLKWAVARADEEYDVAVVEAARVTAGSARVTAEPFPLAAPPEEAARRTRRACRGLGRPRDRRLRAAALAARARPRRRPPARP